VEDFSTEALGPSTNHGQPYGTPVLIPLVAAPAGVVVSTRMAVLAPAGAGGGGAILIASNTKSLLAMDHSAGGGARSAVNGGSVERSDWSAPR